MLALEQGLRPNQRVNEEREALEGVRSKSNFSFRILAVCTSSLEDKDQDAQSVIL